MAFLPFSNNFILAALPDAELQRIIPHLTPMKLERRDVLFEARAKTDYVYFPRFGVVSLILVSTKGVEVEVGVIGREGVVNPAGATTQNQAVTRAMVQFNGDGWRLPNAVFHEEFQRSETFRDRILRFQQTLLAQATQSVLCNRLHSLEERLCRWFLTVRDRVETDDLEMTHEFMAAMLGSRRAGVTETVNKLRGEGLIETRRSHVRLLDRSRLEKTSCECYGITRGWFEKLI